MKAVFHLLDRGEMGEHFFERGYVSPAVSVVSRIPSPVESKDLSGGCLSALEGNELDTQNAVDKGFLSISDLQTLKWLQVSAHLCLELRGMGNHLSVLYSHVDAAMSRDLHFADLK